MESTYQVHQAVESTAYKIESAVEARMQALEGFLSDALSTIRTEQATQNKAIMDICHDVGQQFRGELAASTMKSQELFQAGLQRPTLLAEEQVALLTKQDQQTAELRHEVRALREQVGKLQLNQMDELGCIPGAQAGVVVQEVSPSAAVPTAAVQNGRPVPKLQLSPQATPQMGDTEPERQILPKDQSGSSSLVAADTSHVDNYHAAMGWRKKGTHHADDSAGGALSHLEEELGKDLGMVRKTCCAIAVNHWFITLSNLIVVVNVVVLSIETNRIMEHKVQKALYLEGNGADPGTIDTRAFNYAEYSFLSYMALEFIINFTAFRFHGPNGHWNLFDFCILLLCSLQVFFEGLNLSFLRVLRLGSVMKALKLLRMSKVFKMVRIFKYLSAVRQMILSMIGSMTSLFWALFLLLTIMFILSVGIMQGISLYLDSLVPAVASNTVVPDPNPVAIDEGATHVQTLAKLYGSIEKTMLTLFAPISGGAEWTTLAAPLTTISPIFTLVWLFFISTTLFGVLNILTGIFVESAMTAAREDRDNIIQEELHEKESVTNELRKIFELAETQVPGQVTVVEFEELLSKVEVDACLNHIGLHVSEATGLFKLLDSDGSGGVRIEEFLSGCIRLRGKATAVDMVTLMYENKRVLDKLNRIKAEVDLVARAMLVAPAPGASTVTLEGA